MGRVRGYLDNNYGSLGVGSLGIGSIGYGSLGVGSIGINPFGIIFEAVTFDPVSYELVNQLTGEGQPTFTHPDPLTSLDYKYVYNTFYEDVPVWQSARVVTNLQTKSENFSSGVGDPWQYGIAVQSNLISYTEEDPEGNNTALHLEYYNNTSARLNSVGLDLVDGAEYVLSMWVKSSTSDELNLQMHDGLTFFMQETIIPTTEWKRYTAYGVCGNTTAGQAQLRNTGNTAREVYIAFSQIENVSSRTDKNPSEYVTTTDVIGQKTFANINGNTVLDNVVIEAVGQPLLEDWVIKHHTGLFTNKTLYSNDPSNVAWSMTRTGTFEDAVGLDNILGSAKKILTTDNVYLYQTISSIYVGKPFSVNFYLGYEEVQASSAQFWLIANPNYYGLAFNKTTGEYIVIYNTEAWEDAVIYVNRIGDFWKFTISVITTVSGMEVGFYPTQDDIGEAILGNMEALSNTNADEARLLEPILTEDVAVNPSGTVITYAEDNWANKEGPYYFEFNSYSTDMSLLIKGGLPILKIADNPLDTGYVSVWRTTTPNQTISLNIKNSFSGLIIDWGDGSFEEASPTDYPEHVYEEAGDYTVGVRNINGYSIILYMGVASQRTTLISVLSLGDCEYFSFSNAFLNCYSLESFTSGSSTSTTALGLYNMFVNCTDLISVDFTGSSITDVNSIDYMFSGCSSLTTITGFEAISTSSSIDSVYRMFYNCSSLTTIPDFDGIDTSLATNFSFMFYGCNSITEIPNLNIDTSNGENFASMFDRCWSVTTSDVSWIDTSSATNLSYMFYYCTELTNLNVTGFNVNNVENFRYTFASLRKLPTLNVSSWTTPSATEYYGMFYDMRALQALDVSNFTGGNVIYGSYMFSTLQALTSLDVSTLDTSSMEAVGHMFSNMSLITSLDLTGFDLTNIYWATDFLLNTPLDTASYDAMLIAWGAQTVVSGTTLTANLCKYTSGGAAEAGRDSLTAQGWVINDNGAV